MFPYFFAPAPSVLIWSKSVVVLLGLMTGILLSGCSRDDPARRSCTDALGCIWIAQEDTLRIGSLHTRSGNVGVMGIEYANTLELAVADRNGQMAGRAIEIVAEDEFCSREGGLTAALKLASDTRLLAVHGPTCSGAAVPAAEIFAGAGLVVVSGSATAPSLTATAGKPGEHRQIGFLRTAPNDAAQGLAAATFAYRDLRLRLAATLNDGDPYTRGLAQAFENAFIDLGGQILLSTAVNKGDIDMQPVLTAVAQSGAELLFFPLLPPEGNYLVLAAAAMPVLQHVELISADGLINGSFLEHVGGAAAGMYFVNPVLPASQAYDVFLERYQQKFGRIPQGSFHAHSFDAAEMLLTAVGKALFAEQDGSLRFERQTLRDILYATRDFAGLTGSLNCDGWGDCSVANFALLRLDEAQHGLAGLLQNVVFTF